MVRTKMRGLNCLYWTYTVIWYITRVTFIALCYNYSSSAAIAISQPLGRRVYHQSCHLAVVVRDRRDPKSLSTMAIWPAVCLHCARALFLGHVCILNYISPLHYVMSAEHFSCLPLPRIQTRTGTELVFIFFRGLGWRDSTRLEVVTESVRGLGTAASGF